MKMVFGDRAFQYSLILAIIKPLITKNYGILLL